MTDLEIKEGMAEGALTLDPFATESLQPASYDMRVGHCAFTSTSMEKIDVGAKGLVVIEPGDFAVIETLEKIRCGPQVAAQLGLRSEYARRGLTILSGPQVDPGFEGVLVVRLVNLAPVRVTLPFEAPFLTVQFFRLARDVENPYQGLRQAQSGIAAMDIHELSQTEGMTLGGVIKTLGALAKDVSELKGSVKGLVIWLPVLIALGITIIGIIVAIK